MPRRKRKSTLIIWPSLVCGAIAVLLVRQSLTSPTGGQNAPVRVQGLVSTSYALLPRPLAQPTSPLVSQIDPADRRVDYSEPPAIQSHVAVGLVGPIEFPAEVTLRAPLLESHDELAGWTDPVPRSVTVVTASSALAPTAISPLGRSATAEPSLGWPATPALNSQLKTLDAGPAEVWSGRVLAGLRRLQALQSLGDYRSEEILSSLQELAAQGLQQAELEPDPIARLAWLQSGHALDRRLAVWQTAWHLCCQNQQRENMSKILTHVDRAQVQHTVVAAYEACQQTGDADAWRTYLMLDRILDPAVHTDAGKRRLFAQRLLSRLQWDGLTDIQKSWLRQEPAVSELADTMRAWAAGPVDYTRLLQQLERQEEDPLDIVSIDVAGIVQNLRFASGKLPQLVARAVDVHYRNANIRFALTEELLNDLLPDPPARTQPVSQTILGTRVGGTSKIRSKLRLRLVPDQHRWAMQLITTGNVQAETTGQRSIVRLRTGSEAAFVATSQLTVTSNGATVAGTKAQANQQTVLRGFRTKYDEIPVLGSFVRGLAISEYYDTYPLAKRISESRMETQIAVALDEELEREIESRTVQLSEQLLGPLSRLRLAPTVVDMQTDAQRLSARYRVAGPWQLAAHTPRPRALSNSLFSMQVHQSAINNVFERLAPAEQTKNISILAEEIFAMFGRQPNSMIDQMPADVQVRFAATRPITIQWQDDRMTMTFRIVQLKAEGGVDLRHFIVRAFYRPQYEGLQASFVRDGHLSIQAPRLTMGQRLGIRAVFNRVFDEQQPIKITSDALIQHPALDRCEVNQLVLRDGWLAFAIAPQPSQPTTRTAAAHP